MSYHKFSMLWTADVCVSRAIHYDLYAFHIFKIPAALVALRIQMFFSELKINFTVALILFCKFQTPTKQRKKQ